MLTGLVREGFSDEQVLFTYRTFNSFLLGYLLLETSAMTLRDPKPGDGSFTGTDTMSGDGGSAGPAAASPVIGGLSPVRSAGQREALQDAGSPREMLDPADGIDARRFPTVHRLAAGLAEDRWDGEFETGLEDMLDRIAAFVADDPDVGRD
jgi:TetR/AcrR family transcriptional regulator, tetracycline repressor protein